MGWDGTGWGLGWGGVGCISYTPEQTKPIPCNLVDLAVFGMDCTATTQSLVRVDEKRVYGSCLDDQLPEVHLQTPLLL